ncbi:MAG: hypothetical protein A2W17_00920 [Planctomycetes bacterium RBG_16_41_13]|nr:MAG: hypothetical protein A2W17_00920 [Planctomycetes bacterium RBG_16_41_13]
MAAFAFYPIYRARYALYRHYFTGKLIGPKDDNFIKLYQQGVYDILQRILYYPRMVLEHGLGNFFFYALFIAFFIIVLIIITILVRRLFRMSPSSAGFSKSDIPKTSIYKYEYQLIPYSIFLFQSIGVPLFLLTAYPVRSGNVGLLIAAPCIIAIFILFSQLWVRFNSSLGHKVLFFTKGVLVVALLSIGTLNQLKAYTTVSVSSHNRADYLEVARLYDKIIASSKEFAIKSPAISVNFLENYVLGCGEAITAYCYEHSGELFRVRQKLGSDVGGKPNEKDALNLMRESDFILWCIKEQPLESRNPLYCDPMSQGMANSPFSISIKQIQPVLIEFGKNNFLSKEVYKIFNREVILYVNKNIRYRPVIRSSSQSNDTYSARHILEESNVIWHSKSYPTYPQWVEFEYTSPVIINQLTMRCQPGGSRRAPLEFYFQGEDTGGRWVNLFAVSNASFSQGHEFKSWTVKNNTAFKRYRIYITKNAGAADFVTIAKVGFNYVINDSNK